MISRQGLYDMQEKSATLLLYTFIGLAYTLLRSIGTVRLITQES